MISAGSPDSSSSVIHTERLLLRPLRRDDLEHMQRYAIRPEFYRYLPIPEQTPESVAAFLEQHLADYFAGERKQWLFAIEPHDVGHMVGTIRLSMVNAETRTADMGYALNSEFYGRGYMTEAARAVLDFGFRKLRLHRIWATADVQNVASCRVLERIGMKQEGVLRQDKLVRGQWRDSCLYAVLEDEFNPERK